MIDVLAESGKYFHHPRIELTFVSGELVPVLHIRVMPGKRRSFWQNTRVELALNNLLAIGVPTIVKLAFVFICPLLRDVVRSVIGTRRKVEEEGLVGCKLLDVGNKLDGFVRQVGSKVVALLRRFGWIDTVIVVDQVWIVLMCVP